VTSTLEVTGLRGVVTGRLEQPLIEATELRCEHGRIAGYEATGDAESAIDAQGAYVMPGLIDSHAHVVFGDWTPRQSALGWIASSLHGGVTMMMSASEVHLPGRPVDRAGVKALALTAQRAYSSYRPGGVKVLAGAVIVEPGLVPEDFEELARAGVWLAKVGFGAFDRPADAAPLVRAAQRAGFVVMNHTGGASIPGSSPVTIDDVLALGCDIIGHANGGTTALPDEHLESLFDAPGAIQLVQAGNLRSSLRIFQLAQQRDELHRIVLATDTPTGTGVMPLGMIKTVVELASLGGCNAPTAIALATGNNGAVLRREEGVLEIGRPADLALIQSPLGGSKADALDSIEYGDLPSITAVAVDGELQAMPSRNTPAASAPARLTARAPAAARALGVAG
jgi:enamidase